MRAVKAQASGLPLVVWWGPWLLSNVPATEEVTVATFDPFPASQYTLEQLPEAHAAYLAYLKKCFDSRKAECGHAHKELVFIGTRLDEAAITAFELLDVPVDDWAAAGRWLFRLWTDAGVQECWRRWQCGELMPNYLVAGSNFHNQPRLMSRSVSCMNWTSTAVSAAAAAAAVIAVKQTRPTERSPR